MVMKIKLVVVVVVVVVVACQKQKSTGGARSTTFCRNMGTARDVPT